MPPTRPRRLPRRPSRTAATKIGNHRRPASLRTLAVRFAVQDFLGLGDAGVIGIATSEFQMSCTISQRPFSFTQRTMYLPESAAGAPGGRLAAAGQAKCQRPSSSACGPLAQTDSAHTRRVAGGLDMEFMVVMKARTASPPRTGGMVGGNMTPVT